MSAYERFVKANSRNLPKVDVFMIGEYLYKNDCYNVAEVHCVKAQRYVFLHFTVTIVALAYINVLFGLLLIFTILCCKCLRLKLR
jgi:hypothetical protein